MIDGAEVFLDTNVLLYAAMGSEDERSKHERSLELLTMRFATSGQVLAEFYSNATRKGWPPLEADEALEWVTRLAKKPCQPVDGHIVRSGISISRRYQISYWDGAILAAAERVGAHTVYSEDLNHGQSYGKVRVVNPFLVEEGVQ